MLQRIRMHDAALNSFVTVTEELALAQAKAADARSPMARPGPLTGIPIAHKTSFAPAMCAPAVVRGCSKDFVSPYDATVVENLQRAGVVMLGKTNMDEFAMGSSNETSHFSARCAIPWDRETVPGGSSGGSAAAVAARLCVAATGTDTGGSIRQPAALTGITGIKPTYGRCSRWG